MAAILFESGFNYLQLERDLQRGKMSVGDFVRENERAGKQIDSLWKNAGTAVAAYFTFDFAKSIGSQIIEVRGQMQQLTVAFTTMLGSKEKADALMQQMVNTAASTPFSLTQVADGAKRLLAYGISAETVNDTLVKLGNAASGVSVPLDRMILAYGQVKAKGKLQGDDMRQFMEMGLPLVHQLAMQFGVADSEISKMVESGKVGFSAVEQAINSMTGAGGQFYNLMQEQSKTIPGMISNLGDSIDQMFNKLGTDNQGTIEGTIGLLSLMVENYQLFINILKIAVAAYGSYKAAVIAVSIAEKVRYQMTLAQMASTQGLTTLQALQAIVIGKVKDAQALLNKTMLANPYALAAAAIIALVATLVLFSDNATAAEKAAKKLGDITKDAADGAKEERAKIDALISTIRSEVTTREQKNDALKKLNDIMPDNLGYITEEAVRTGKATAAIDTYIRSVERQIKIDAIREEMKQSQQRLMGAGKNVGFGSSVWNTIKAGGNAAVGQALAIADVVGEESQYQQALMTNLKKLTEEGIVIENKVSQAKKRTITVIDAEIKQKKDEQQAVASTNAEYKAYEQQIKKLEAEREGISGGKKSGKAVADVEAYREQLYKVYSEINKDKEALMKDGFEKEMSTIKNAYSDQLAAVSKQEADLLAAYNKSKGLKKGDKSYISQLPEEAKDAIDKLRALAEQAKASKELSLFFGEGKDQIVEDNSMDALLESTKTFEQKRLNIVGQAMLDIATLENKGLTSQAAVRRKKMKDDVGELEASHRTELKSWAYLYENIDKWGKKALLARVAMLKEDAKVSKITAEEKLAINKALADTEAELAKKGPLDALKIINENIEKAKKKVAEAKTLADKQKAQGELDTETAKKGAILSDTFSTVAGHLQGIAGIVGQFNQSLGESIELASSLSGAFSQIAQGNYAAGIISAAASLFSFMSNLGAKEKREEAARQQQEREVLQQQLEVINKLYEIQKNLIDDTFGTDKILQYNKAIGQARDNLSGVVDQYNKFKLEANKPNGKLPMTFFTGMDIPAGKDLINELLGGRIKQNKDLLLKPITEGASMEEVEQIKKKNREIIENMYKFIDEQSKSDYKFNFLNKGEFDKVISNYEKYIEEMDTLLNRKRAELTGSTSDSIVDGLASAFDDGVVSAEEFTETFGALMKKQVLNALKMQMLEKPLKDFYAQFALASESGGSLTAEEVIALRATYEKIAADAKIKFDDLNSIMKGAGLDLFGGSAGSKENSAVGIVKNLSENTGTEIVGNLTGMRYDIREQNMTIKEQLGLMNQSVVYQQQIAANTEMSAARLSQVVDRLDRIGNKLGVTGSNQNEGRATGK